MWLGSEDEGFGTFQGKWWLVWDILSSCCHHIVHGDRQLGCDRWFFFLILTQTPHKHLFDHRWLLTSRWMGNKQHGTFSCGSLISLRNHCVRECFSSNVVCLFAMHRIAPTADSGQDQDPSNETIAVQNKYPVNDLGGPLPQIMKLHIAWPCWGGAGGIPRLSWSS